MADAAIERKIDVSAKDLFKIITEYEKYVDFVEGVTKVEVLKREGNRVRVKYSVSVMKDVVYTVDHVEDEAAGKNTWTLVDSDAFKVNTGAWEIKALGPNQCQVKYSLTVEFKIPVPGFILKRLIAGSLPSMIESFEKRTKG